MQTFLIGHIRLLLEHHTQLLDFPRRKHTFQDYHSRTNLTGAQSEAARSRWAAPTARIRFDFDSFARATPQLPARQWTRSSRLDRSQISGRLLETLSFSRASFFLTEAEASSRSFSSSHTQGVLFFSFLFLFRLVSIIQPPLLSPPSRPTSCVFSTSIHQGRKKHEFSQRNTSFLHDLRLPSTQLA